MTHMGSPQNQHIHHTQVSCQLVKIHHTNSNLILDIKAMTDKQKIVPEKKQ